MHKKLNPQLFDMPQTYDELAVAYGECRKKLLDARRRIHELEAEKAKFLREKAHISAERAAAGRLKKGTGKIG